MRSPRILVTIVCLVCLPLAIPAQPLRTSAAAKSPAEQEAEQKKEKELEQKALAVLDELIEEARAFRLPENRVKIWSYAADMFWLHDQARARGLFGEAMKVLAQLVQQPEDSPDSLPENMRWQVYGWRQEIVQLVARHDAQLAMDFLSSTRPADAGQQGPHNAENETQLELMLAQQVAQQDPQRALKIAKEKLATAKNPGVIFGALHTLREKDFASAQELADAILARLRAETQFGHESASSALNLLGLAPPPINNGETASGDQPKYLITPAAARELIEKITAAVQAELAKARRQTDSNQRHNTANLINQLKSVMPHIEKYAPASLPAVKRLLPEAAQMMDAGQRRWEELNGLAQKGSADLLIEAAAKAPPDMQYHYFQRAAQLARDQGNPERARQIIKENVGDVNQQRQALREIDQQAMWKSISEGRFDEARRLMPGLRNDWERANILTQMSATALNGGKKELAAQFLVEAWALVGGQAESSQQFNSQLQLAGAFVALEPTRSFEIIESTLDQVNELIAAAALLESFDQQGSFRQKEMILSSGGRASQYLYQYGQHLAALARADLSRVQTVINRFARPEARALVRLIVLQQLLRRSGGGHGTIGLGRFSRIH